ncbi:hypothetical protein TIFTF001_029665 [Ficus carica]|uniref:Uncharacterized protein n=1 Tax=Ficus carica TaxID=3494 RepID=A0AA88DS37_FICCA|nr:hypothetical protein TIFTF001_029665 [Ficus carica]
MPPSAVHCQRPLKKVEKNSRIAVWKLSRTEGNRSNTSGGSLASSDGAMI